MQLACHALTTVWQTCWRIYVPERFLNEEDEVGFRQYHNRLVARELESEDFGPALDARHKLVALATYAVSSSPLIFGPVNTQLSNLHAILANPLLTPADRVSNLFRELLQLFQPADKRLSPRLLDEPLVRSEIIQMTEHYGNALLFHDNA